MSFVCNRNEHGKSEIVQNLCPDCFGISIEQFEDEIRLCQDDEFNGLVGPVSVDKDGCHFIKFNSPISDIRSFYFEENNCFPEGIVNEIIKEDN